MSYLGRLQLGGTAPLYLRCVNTSNQPSVPDNPPQFKVFTGTTLVEAKLMPVEERYATVGLFRYPLFLGRLYSTGHYQVIYYYNVSGYYGIAEDNFEIVGGGDNRGAVVSGYFYERPEAAYIVQALENGSVIKGRNPTI